MSDLTKYTADLPATIKELKNYKTYAQRKYAALVQGVKALESMNGADAYIEKAKNDAGAWEIKAWLAEARIGELLGPGKSGPSRESTNVLVDRNDRAFARQFFQALQSGALGKHIEEVEEHGPVAYYFLANKAHVANNSNDDEWFTPPEYIEAAREVLGEIDLDPASCDEAQKVVKARQFYSADALDLPWKGRVWMNPPYSSNLVEAFCWKLRQEVASGNTTEAVVLTNDAMETKWMQGLISEAAAICFPQGRIRFWKPDKATFTPLQGQVITYFGTDPTHFCEVFSRFGKAAAWHPM